MTTATEYKNSEQNVMTDIYPVQTRTASGEVNGHFTEIVFVTFADKLLFTICQNGRLAQWVSKTLIILIE